MQAYLSCPEMHKRIGIACKKSKYLNHPALGRYYNVTWVVRFLGKDVSNGTISRGLQANQYSARILWSIVPYIGGLQKFAKTSFINTQVQKISDQIYIFFQKTDCKADFKFFKMAVIFLYKLLDILVKNSITKFTLD